MQIAQLESRLAHSSLPLNEEKKVVEDIKKLKASRATSAGYDERMEKLNADDKLWQQIKDKMSEADARLDAIQKLQVPFPAPFDFVLRTRTQPFAHAILGFAFVMLIY
jgi:uncharacterized coiled-coil DUF342 family protein